MRNSETELILNVYVTVNLESQPRVLTKIGSCRWLSYYVHVYWEDYEPKNIFWKILDRKKGKNVYSYLGSIEILDGKQIRKRGPYGISYSFLSKFSKSQQLIPHSNMTFFVLRGDFWFFRHLKVIEIRRRCMWLHSCSVQNWNLCSKISKIVDFDHCLGLFECAVTKICGNLKKIDHRYLSVNSQQVSTHHQLASLKSFGHKRVSNSVIFL